MSRSSELRRSSGAAGRGFFKAQRHSSDDGDIEQHVTATLPCRVQQPVQDPAFPNSLSSALHTLAAGAMLVTEIAAISAESRQDFGEKRIILMPA